MEALAEKRDSFSFFFSYNLCKKDGLEVKSLKRPEKITFTEADFTACLEIIFFERFKILKKK